MERRQLEADKTIAETKLSTIQEWETRNGRANKKISTLYHPYDLETGAIRPVDDLQSGLTAQFADIKSLAEEMSLSEKSIRRIESATNYITPMLTTMQFYFSQVDEMIALQTLPSSTEDLLKNVLIPVEYLKIASAKEEVARNRHAIMQVASHLEERLKDNREWNHQTLKEQNILKQFAQKCAQIFQRSSSCVEGRNSHLTLWHHGVSHICPRKASSITVTNNFCIKRPDNTTAAERFFENKPRNLFQYLLEKMPLPSRSRKKIIMKSGDLSMVT